jgi:hypothetical protein
VITEVLRTSSFSSVSRLRLATKASRPLACSSPLGIGLERGDGPETVDEVGVLVRPFGDGPDRVDTADRAVAPLEMIEPFEVAFGLGGDVGAAGTEDVDRRAGARAGLAISRVYVY